MIVIPVSTGWLPESVCMGSPRSDAEQVGPGQPPVITQSRSEEAHGRRAVASPPADPPASPGDAVQVAAGGPGPTGVPASPPRLERAPKPPGLWEGIQAQVDRAFADFFAGDYPRAER
jgi:hypothetical protein